VAEGSPAGKAGLEVGDVIVSFGGEKIATAEEIIKLVHSSQIGQKIEITYWRGDTENTTMVTPSESPPPS
jgi:S1-C subfamily serine protease